MTTYKLVIKFNDSNIDPIEAETNDIKGLSRVYNRLYTDFAPGLGFYSDKFSLTLTICKDGKIFDLMTDFIEFLEFKQEYLK